MNPEVMEQVKKAAAVPSVPQVVVRFLEITQDPQFDYGQLVDLLSTDPGTTGEILRLANSALFGVARQITSIRQAMTLLGMRRVRSLVLGRYIVSTLGNHSGPVDVSYFWRRSLATAVLSAKLSHEVLPRMQEEAFIAALLSDVGIVVLSDTYGERYQPVVNEYCPGGSDQIASLEQRICGATHAEVSALVLDSWQLPEMIVEAVRLHHEDSTDDAQIDSALVTMAQVVNGAGRIAKHLCEKPDAPAAAETCRHVAEILQIDMKRLPDMFEQIERDIEDLASVLSVDVIPSRVYQRIAQEIQQHVLSSMGAAAPGA